MCWGKGVGLRCGCAQSLTCSLICLCRQHVRESGVVAVRETFFFVRPKKKYIDNRLEDLILTGALAKV